MKSPSKRVLVGLVAALALSVGLVPAATAHRAPHHDKGRSQRHVFVIMMENHGYSQIIGNTADAPFTNQLAKVASTATNYYGVTHPSLPNYLAAISGDFQGIWDDCKAGASVFCAPEEFVPGSGDATDGNYLTPAQIASASATPHLFGGQNIVDQLEARGLTWRAYMQSMPAVGSEVEYAPEINGTTVKLYAQKHNPFMYFSDVNYPGSPRLANIVPFDGFASDLQSGNVPNFVWISPDQCNDMHGISPSQAELIGKPTCGYPDSGLDHGAIQLGDAFLKNTVTAITHSRTWRTSHSSIVIVWDEDDYSAFGGCCGSPTGVNGVVLGGARVPLLVLNSHGKHRHATARPANHYSLLAAIEHTFKLHCLSNACSAGNKDRLRDLFHK